MTSEKFGYYIHYNVVQVNDLSLLKIIQVKGEV